MTTDLAEIKANTALTIQGFLGGDKVKTYLEGVMKERAPQFIASLVSLSNLTPGLAQCEPRSLMMCGLKAASLNLPLDNNLGFAYAIPYKNREKGITEAQFQMGYRAFIQLGMRTGLYKSMNVIDIRDGELVLWDALTEDLKLKIIDNEIDREKTPIHGYAAMFELRNGFRKVIYKKRDALLAHGVRFSKAYKSGPWQSDVDAMCKKTLIKELLSKWGPLSTEIMEGIKYDQSVIRETESGATVPDYTDNQDEVVPKQVTYDIPEGMKEDIDNLADILGINEAEKAMELGLAKGDIKKVEAYREKLKAMLSKKEQSGQAEHEQTDNIPKDDLLGLTDTQAAKKIKGAK
jgi:recombination protein RecT